jgi:hypothetical protein
VKRNAADLAALLFAVDLDDAACAGAPVEFVDPSPADVDDLIRDWCHHCPVVGRCREYGDTLAPHEWLTVMGARAYDKGEPVDGWEVAS